MGVESPSHFHLDRALFKQHELRLFSIPFTGML